MNILAIDAGNTRVKWGLYDGRRWIAMGAVGKQETVRLSDAWKQLPTPTKIIVSNVAGELIRSELNVLVARWRISPTWITSRPAQCGVVNGYTQPSQLGCDRWAALIGAHHSYDGPAIVVMAGTAITIDALTNDGRFLGGLILPGLTMMIDALTARTAGIRTERGEYRVFPTNTGDAVWTAAIQAAAGAADRLRLALASQMAEAPMILLSGGAAEVLQPHLSGPVTRMDNLVLDGLAYIAGDMATEVI